MPGQQHQHQAGDRCHRERGERRGAHGRGPGEAGPDEPQRAHAVGVGPPDAVGVVVGEVHADLQREGDEQRERGDDEVRAAAFASFAVAAVAGLVLVLLTGHWWLLAVGAASVLAAWYYTGGRRPYGYRGLGEAFVFVFFGLVAVGGTGYVQTGRVTVALLLTGVWVGALTTAILVANNLRDLRGDAATGKLTLATRLGDRRTRSFYVALVAVGALGLAGVAALTTVWALLGLLPLLLLVRPALAVLSGSVGRDLIAVLKTTGTAELLAAVVSALALVLL